MTSTENPIDDSKANDFHVLVRVIPIVETDQLHDDDRDVVGDHSIQIDAGLPRHQIADAALDVFHNSVAVTVLDNFQFEVWWEGLHLSPNPDHAGYSLKHAGVLAE